MPLISVGQEKQTNDSDISFSLSLSLTYMFNKPIIITYPSIVPIYKSLVRIANGFVEGVESLFVSIHSI